MRQMNLENLQIYRFWLKQRGLRVPDLNQITSHQEKEKMHPLAFLGNKQDDVESEHPACASLAFPTPWVAQSSHRTIFDQFLILVFPEYNCHASPDLTQPEKNLLNNIVQAMNLNISELSREPFAEMIDETGLLSPKVLKSYLLKVIRGEGARKNCKILFFADKALTDSLISVFTYDLLLVRHPQYPGVQTLFQIENTSTVVFLHSLAEMLGNKDLKRPVWDMLKIVSAETALR